MANDRLGMPVTSYVIAPPRQPAYMNQLAQIYGGANSTGIEVQRHRVGMVETLLGMLGAGGTGALLGTLQSELKNGLDYGGKVPIDALLSLIATAGGMAYNSPGSVRMGQNAFAIYTFRKTSGLLTMLRGMVAGNPPTVSAPDLSRDPLEDAAKEL